MRYIAFGVLAIALAFGCSRLDAKPADKTPEVAQPAPLPARLEETDRLQLLVLQLDAEKASMAFQAGVQQTAVKYALRKGDGMDFRTGVITRQKAAAK